MGILLSVYLFPPSGLTFIGHLLIQHMRAWASGGGLAKLLGKFSCSQHLDWDLGKQQSSPLENLH